MEHLMHNYYEAAAVILFGIGFMNLLLQSNLIKKFIGLNIMDTAVYLFLAAKGFIYGRVAPIVTSGEAVIERFVNPVPSGLSIDWYRCFCQCDRFFTGFNYPSV